MMYTRSISLVVPERIITSEMNVNISLAILDGLRMWLMLKYLQHEQVGHTNMSVMECGLPTQLSFFAREVSDETFSKAVEDYDPECKRVLHLLQKCQIKVDLPTFDLSLSPEEQI